VRYRIQASRTPAGRQKGFTFIEALLSIALLGIALLGLAQMFMLSIRNNQRGGEISQAMFLGQQQIDYLRTLTASEIGSFPATARGESADEALDINHDGTNEYRRLTQITVSGAVYNVKVLVFPSNELSTAASVLYADPPSRMVRATMNTVISR
jgi:prepilin-type N-terminal cleavage/methylation domain-containing protein